MSKAMPIIPRRLKILSRASWHTFQGQVEDWALQELDRSVSRRIKGLVLPAVAAALACSAGLSQAPAGPAPGHTTVL